ncbi:hypothetical protein [Algoriphagus sp. Y33]|uniref:hypothetical protein n=1 Tax=Algoriphagus sp. Y33 TaxID=2772483 RepID=UPI0017839407|nr:hypothetical protein [Algoriphagus sp. Y33]
MIRCLYLVTTQVVDEKGDFASQHAIGSSFPNWNGLDRTSDELRLRRVGDRLIENLPLENDALVIIEWQLIQD